jgi:DMSO/TMAO reductase YedYZ molybdopterin-dependent catalytic subunit
MRPTRFALVLLAFNVSGILLQTQLLQAQAAPSAAALTVGGAVEHPLTLSLADIAKMRRSAIQTKAHDGSTVSYEGVLISDLMQAAGVPSGEKLRGADLAACLLATAKDGYRVVFSLAELDAAFTDSKVLVADRMNGKPLPAGQGPLKLVAPRDKRAARSVRELERLEVVRVAK